MKNSIVSSALLSRRGLLSLGLVVSLAIFAIIASRGSRAQSNEDVELGNGGALGKQYGAGSEIVSRPGYPDAPLAVAFTSALVYDDAFNNPTGSGIYQNALTGLGIPFTDFGSNIGAFSTAVTNANPLNTLVIVDNFNNFQPWDTTSVNAFVGRGGRVIFFTFDLDGTNPFGGTAFKVPQTLATFQVASVNTFGENGPPNDPALPVYNWVTGSSIFTGLPNPMPVVEASFTDNGDKMEPAAGGTSLAGFSQNPATGQAAMISGNQGRTLIHGFSIDEVPGNFADRVTLATNEIRFVAAGTNIPPNTFIIDDVRLTEGNSGTTPFTFTVSRLGALGFPAIVQFETRDGSASVANQATVADGDYQAISGSLNFGFFETTKTITVLVNGDTKVEPDERFTVHLQFNPNTGGIGDADGTGIIVNDDFPPPTPTPTPTPTPPNRFEGDINRTSMGVAGTGDMDVNVADQLQYLRFFSGTDCPSASEQPRLDAGPLNTRGDGLLGQLDGGAIDTYARHDSTTDFDPNTAGWQATPVSGPAAITNLTCTVPPDSRESDNVTPTVAEPASAAAARVIRMVQGSANGRDITVEIEMSSQGNEAGTQFGVHFDPSVLSLSGVSGVNTNPDIAFAADSPDGTKLNVNAGDVANGNIAIVENFNSAGNSIKAISEGARRIASVTFHVRSGAAAGESKLTFDESVIKDLSADTNGLILGATYQNGSITIPAISGAAVSGRVTSPDGRGIRNATVTIVDGHGFARSVTTSSFGYYSFEGIGSGETYTIGVSSRTYRFASRSITITDSLTAVDFTGLE